MKPSDAKTARRPHGRAPDALRPLRLQTGVQRFAEGSALIELGDTQVLVAASLESRVPPFLADTGRGWVTAEYAMLPRSTPTRKVRDSSRGRPDGRSQEIQRLIGRSLRAAVDFKALGPSTITLDCDVIQADGGTRTAAITGAYVALVEAAAKGYLSGDLPGWPLRQQIAAVSVGYVDGQPLLDLEYCEDSVAEVDLNVVATGAGELVEVQGTGEKRGYTRQELDRLLDLAELGMAQLVAAQNEALAETLDAVRRRRERGKPKVEPRDEASLWGPPG